MSESQSQISLLGKVAEYTEILAGDPRSKVFVPLSEAYRRLDMLDDALEIASQGVQARPDYAAGHIALGRIQAQRENFSEAAKAFRRALQLEKSNPSALKGMARVLVKLGRVDQARQCLQRVVALQPEDRAVRRMLDSLTAKAPGETDADSSTGSRAVRSASASGEVPEEPSREITEQARELSGAKEGEPISTATIAELYIRQGFPQRALKVYRDILQAEPQNEVIRCKLEALKKRLAADEAPEEAPAPVGDEVAGEKAVPARKQGASEEVLGREQPKEAYRKTLERWLVSVRQRREHVR